MPPRTIDREVLEAALLGLEQRRSEIERKIADLRHAMGQRGSTRKAAAVAPKRKMSAAGKARIAAAARKRWAEYRKVQRAAGAEEKE